MHPNFAVTRMLLLGRLKPRYMSSIVDDQLITVGKIFGVGLATEPDGVRFGPRSQN